MDRETKRYGYGPIAAGVASALLILGGCGMEDRSQDIGSVEPDAGAQPTQQPPAQSPEALPDAGGGQSDVGSQFESGQGAELESPPPDIGAPPER